MYIVITLPHFFEGETDAVTLMFQSGLQRLHFRKPGSTVDECREWMRRIPEAYLSRIVVHDHYELAREFNLGGIHLNGRNQAPSWLDFDAINVSCSCHAIEELKEKRMSDYRYLSLSPIFDSISKQGYNAAFTSEQLLKAKADGVIDERVMALGGISHDNIGKAMKYGFGGAMVLGDAWKKGCVLSIAGSDCSAGAGIQQDLKAATYCRTYAATVITAVTSQNTLGVQGVMPIPADVVETQLRSVFDDVTVGAVKIGMIPNRDVASIIIKVLREEKSKRVLPVVLDPVMISTSGTRLMSEDCVEMVVKELFPLCTLITPNIPEWEFLSSNFGNELRTLNVSILTKGGHADGDVMTDVLHLADTQQIIEYTAPRIKTQNLHGTGCTLSTAIASFMAKRQSVAVAVDNAKQVMNTFIAGGATLNVGHGNGPLWAFGE